MSNHTIGVDFASKIVEVGGKTVKLQAGQERFRSVTRSYYRGSAGIVLVYDVANRDTYNHITNWLSDARALASKDATIILVGNKSDLSEKREVSFLEASNLSMENDLLFLETSALSGDNVEEIFLKCAKTVVSKLDDGNIDMEGLGIQIGDGDSNTVLASNSEARSCQC
ncbi:Rab GTPase [Cavenderia fasciculata]|uniref:Rab GTPase n=1 Tax=Cavenderia fasciculata TaxID=261658 RepID=F4PHM1_CACFS|nr:Rab GTPase [Cavenderia fasciculata]EGG25205.1 Rab GTPase [Cavenderia fasciculata]|eukprot:XP_004363056.1 Rab GTPase [Cavenderia fasciculata]